MLADAPWRDGWTPGPRLGRGGTGEVWAAWDPEGRAAAVKLVPLPPDAHPDWPAATLREIGRWAALRDPGLVLISGWGYTAEGVYLIMERLHGEPLSKRNIEDPASLAAAATGWASCLAGAHAAGLVHDDLKPGHLFVEPDGRSILVDFALPAPALDGVSMASPRWAAPECFDHVPPAPAADVYAFAQCLWEALAGRAAFTARGRGLGALLELADQKRAAGPPDPLPHVPEAWNHLFKACAARKPEERPTMREVAEILARR